MLATKGMRVTRPMLNFKSFRAAKSVLAGIELMRMIRKKASSCCKVAASCLLPTSFMHWQKKSVSSEELACVPAPNTLIND